MSFGDAYLRLMQAAETAEGIAIRLVRLAGEGGDLIAEVRAVYEGVDTPPDLRALIDELIKNIDHAEVVASNLALDLRGRAAKIKAPPDQT